MYGFKSYINLATKIDKIFDLSKQNSKTLKNESHNQVVSAKYIRTPSDRL